MSEPREKPEETEDDILPPDPEAYATMKQDRERDRAQVQRDIKEEYMLDIQQALKRANNNGYLSYRDLVPMLKEIFDEEEIQALKILL